MRADVVQIGGRVVTVVLIGLGVWFAIGLAFQSQNFTLAGILLATIVASFGVQDVLKDYVSGYYVLLERHMQGRRPHFHGGGGLRHGGGDQAPGDLAEERIGGPRGGAELRAVQQGGAGPRARRPSGSPKPLVRPLSQRLPNDAVERSRAPRRPARTPPPAARGSRPRPARRGCPPPPVSPAIEGGRCGPACSMWSSSSTATRSSCTTFDQLPDLRGAGLGRVREVQAVEAAEDAVALAQRAGTRLRDARLAEVVAHLGQRVRPTR